MLKNYLRLTWLNFKKNKTNCVISTVGLSMGISICMLVLLYLNFQFSFDRFHRNAGRIFSVSLRAKIGNSQAILPGLSFESASMIKQTVPAVEGFTRIKNEVDGDIIIENLSAPGKKFIEKKIVLGDPNFFNFFSFRLLAGNTETALKDPYDMVLSLRAAHKYFGDSDPVGKLLKYNKRYVFKITGIAADPPPNSSIDFDFIGSISSILSMPDEKPDVLSSMVDGGDFATYLLLKKQGDERSIAAVLDHLRGSRKTAGGQGPQFTFILTNLRDQHLNGPDRTQSKYLQVFTYVAIIILILAVINYMNLTIVRSSARSMEIGVRKTLGASNMDIAVQFYFETAIYTLTAFLLGLLEFVFFQHYFYNITELQIDNSFIFNWNTLLLFSLLLLIIVILAGSYPSLVLSSVDPLAVLKNRFYKGNASSVIRNLFIVLQFTISTALIISSIIINKQLFFLKHTDTGLQKDNIVMIPYQKGAADHYFAFRGSIQAIPGVTQVATALYPMYGGADLMVGRPGNDRPTFPVEALTVDNSFIDLVNLKWMVPPGDKQSILPNQVVINEEALEKFDLLPNPIGRSINIGNEVMVTGVLKNFNYYTLHNKIDPLCLFIKTVSDSSWITAGSGCLFVRLSRTTNIPGMLETISRIYASFDKETPFQYQFMDVAFDAMYKAEDRLYKIINIFTGLTILIALMGLFGMTAFYTSLKQKEIGIRKVLGASVARVTTLLSGYFLGLILLSIAIASPIGWYLSGKWLQDFAYRITIEWWVFALTGVLVLAIALFTISFLTIRAALANPVKTLRVE